MRDVEILAYSATTAAKSAEVSRATIYRWMKLRGFPVVRIGGCTRIPVEAFKRWLAEQAEEVSE